MSTSAPFNSVSAVSNTYSGSTEARLAYKSTILMTIMSRLTIKTKYTYFSSKVTAFPGKKLLKRRYLEALKAMTSNPFIKTSMRQRKNGKRMRERNQVILQLVHSHLRLTSNLQIIPFREPLKPFRNWRRIDDDLWRRWRWTLPQWTWKINGECSHLIHRFALKEFDQFHHL